MEVEGPEERPLGKIGSPGVPVQPGQVCQVEALAPLIPDLAIQREGLFVCPLRPFEASRLPIDVGHAPERDSLSPAIPDFTVDVERRLLRLRSLGAQGRGVVRPRTFPLPRAFHWRQTGP